MHRTVPAVVAALLAAPLQAGVIVGYNPATNDRFAAGFPTAPVPNDSPAFLGAGLDLSGVGWRADAPNFAVTLVTPQNFVTAAHVGVGSQVRFADPSGVVHTYSVAGTTRLTTTFTNAAGVMQTLPSDLLLGTLSAPIPAVDRITSYAIAGLPTNPAGTPLLVYGQNPAYSTSPHLGTNTLDGTDLASFDNFASEATVVGLYDFTPGVPNEIYLIGGDSGGPAFTVINGQLALLGTHYAVSNPTLNPNPGDLSASTFVPFYTAQLNQDVAGTGFQVRVLAVPEPGVVTVGVVMLAGAVVRRRVNRKPVV